MRIFSTKILSEQELEALPSACTSYHEDDFIRIEHRIDADVLKKIESLLHLPLRVIITSKQSVFSLQKHLSKSPSQWNIWCIAPATSRLCASWLGEDSIQHTAFDANELKHTLMHDSYVFFRGNVASDVLPDYCRSNQIDLQQLEVYQQFQTPKTVDGSFDYYLFFSPSGVESFLSENELPETARAIAIGNSTQSRLQKYGHKLIFTAAAPSAQAMFETIEYEHAKK